ncbi:MAG: BlaI/MecI/CopY family transcriptional regulator [Oscillospiraceae bacterium]|nr:BlaI/MecI/CopY family transcriptional regulator [Oscillospiraceae bacterium]
MAAKPITGAEAEVMRLLWREQRPMTLAQIREALLQTTKWNHSTIKTLVFRLRDKGVITHLDKYGAAQYIPSVTEDEYLLDESETMLCRLFGGSAVKMVATLRQGGRLSDSDIAELREFFRGDGK